MDKKHEDVGGVAQIDKTSVFQEGTAAWRIAGSCCSMFGKADLVM
jgi:hypothetical protein